MARREGDKTDEILLKHVAKELNKSGSLHFFYVMKLNTLAQNLSFASSNLN